MPFSNLLIHDLGAIRTITVNRPEKLNALNSATIAELDRAFAEAEGDSQVRCVILTGAGPKAFVAGADIAEMQELTPSRGRDFSLTGTRMMQRIERLHKPVIAMITGFALGGGLELAMCCHLRIASENAKLGLPEVTLGLLPGFGGTQRLLRLAGRAATLEMCLTGTPINARRAAELGIVNRVVSIESLQEVTLELATRLAQAAPLAVRAILDTVLVGGEMPINDGLLYESTQFGLIFASDDMREGTQAFLDKRAPVFKGH